VPHPRNAFFTGREQTLSRLVQAFQACRQVGLSGLGGLGKTQTAVEYAYRHREAYQAILWASAETVEALTSSLGVLCHVLRLRERTAADQGLAVAAVTRWLSHSSDWLLILDNAEDLSILRPFIPSDPQGWVLVTTRARATGTIEPLDMEKMAPEEGALFLLRRARCLARDASLDHASAVDHQAALAIVEKLDGLPLAIDQAGAYIEETPSTLGEYLDLYKAEGKALRAARGELAPDHASVSVTFSLAFKQVAERSQAAADLILACACLGPDAIPEEIFTEGAAALGDVLGGATTSLAQFAKLLREATRYSLIERQPAQRTLKIHRVVQGVLKDEMGDAAYRQWTERVVRALDTVFPDVEVTTWGRCERLLAHAQACVDHIARCGFLFPEAARLLNRVGHYLHERARYAEAEQPYGRALAIREQALGPEHPDVARSLNHLAALYGAQGQYGKAERLYRRALAIREQALGREHPDVARSLNNLAALYGTQGQYGKAEPLYRRALAILEQALGPEHPDVAASLNNLAALYGAQGQYGKAEPLYRRALAIREQALGPEHPDVARTLNNLAELYGAQGQYGKAEPLYRRALAILEQALGPEHPDVATSLNNLAALYEAEGQYGKAEPLYQRALAIWEQALGPEHPVVATSLENYASLLRKTERDAEAVPLESRAQAIRAKHAQDDTSR
jgi:tetratricopeptide (TPR) repeat protein